MNTWTFYLRFSSRGLFRHLPSGPVVPFAGLMFPLAAVLACCGQTSCPAGSTERGGRCEAIDASDAEVIAAATCDDGVVDDAGMCAIDPCAPDLAPCDPHASCTVVQNAAECHCDEGYQGDGATCERDPCAALEDEPAPCGEHQVCEPSGDAEDGVHCVCAEGYGDCDGDPQNGCETDLAGDVGHCGGCGLACAEDLACNEAACEQRVTTLDIGYRDTCALSPEGDVLCWGLGSVASSAMPKRFPSYSPADLLTVGAYHACVRRRGSDTMTCWGSNSKFQLGVKNTGAAVFSASVPGLEDLSADRDHTCAIAEGKVYCWGDNSNGQLGDPGEGGELRALDLSRPVSSGSEALSGAVQVATGTAMSCALLRTGEVRCWGMHPRGNDAEYVREAYLAEAVCGEGGALSDATRICVGNHQWFSFGCAVREDGSLVCWGFDPAWRLQTEAGAVFPPALLFREQGLTDVVDVACGSQHVCVRTRAGKAYCWGDNSAGQLGISTSEPAHSEPAQVVGLSGVTGIYASMGFALRGSACARLKSGDVYCWGDNDNKLLGLDGSSYSTPQALTEWP